MLLTSELIKVITDSSFSFTQLDSSVQNLDMQELEYNPSKKDLTDAKIHHLLSEELCKPRRVIKRLTSYLYVTLMTSNQNLLQRFISEFDPLGFVRSCFLFECFFSDFDNGMLFSAPAPQLQQACCQ